MSTVQSSDGTTIAYEKRGDGPPVVLVDGALCHRRFGPAHDLAEQLAGSHTVYIYDRRGRGESGDGESYSVEREVADLQAIIGAAGGSAYVYGISSGAALALESARTTPGIAKLALYEAPFIVDDSRDPLPVDYTDRQRESLAAGRPGDAVTRFMKFVGVPAPFRAFMRLLPAWRKLKAAARTLPYDAMIVEDYQRGKPLPAERWSGVTVPTVVIAGGKSPEWMRTGNRALADAVPGAAYRVLDGQTHMVKPRALAPVLVEFFSAREAALSA